MPPPKGVWFRPLWRRRRLPAAPDGWYDGRLPNGVWVRYRVEAGWIVTAYATQAEGVEVGLLGSWGEPERVITYPVPGQPRRRRGRWPWGRR